MNSVGTVAQFVTALLVLITAIIALYATWSANRRADKLALQAASLSVKAEVIHVGVERVHEVVNSRLTALLDRQETLIKVLQEHGIDVPPRAPEPGENVIGFLPVVGGSPMATAPDQQIPP